MSEAVVHVESGAEPGGEKVLGGRTRTCVGCGVAVPVAEAADLVRLVFGPGGEVAVDARGGAFGRGAHVHARPACLERAARGGLARSTKGRAAPVDAATLARTIQEAMDRRIEGLFVTAARAKHLARGSDAVTDCCRRGEAALVVVARDAAAASELTEVRRAVAEGRAVAWGDKQRLGRVVTLGADREGAGVAVVAIASPPIAEALREAVQIADACVSAAAAPPRRGGGRSGGEGAKMIRSDERRRSRGRSNLERGA